jgi:putative ABC transport system ATP-binding protein
MELLQALNIQRGVTIIVVTHAPEIARYAQRVIRCQDGLVVEDRAVSVAHPSQGPGCELVAVSDREDGQ